MCSKPVSLVSDAADEFKLGWLHMPSLPNRFPHNSQLEREIRSFQEGVRSSFLEAGFAVRPELWPVACRYGSMAMNLSHPAPLESDLSRWDFAVAHFDAEDVPPWELILGQLVSIGHAQIASLVLKCQARVVCRMEIGAWVLV